ncbi:GTP-binding protein EngA [Acholeplasma oculi]|uniref:GTPase Der n=1 Tax=Acholeplasma oculi TaxID=35623 RepID=A0A061AB37_9MOLU|nr:ribosome biogenesis GTPase Der [Acholeplasma oculi]CDR31068.1 GTP-binding protein EngA [Acholeplasma oculi]SKC36766.1 GTP-binding protein [Acholeplasma oculi]SUT90680.1 GTP-binding protein EngA [Acholeplasma oculi]
MPFTVAIVGRPNVGKSSLFNRILGERLSITDDVAGVTRDRIYAQAEWLTKRFSIIDTGGIDIGDAPFLTQIKHQAEIAMDEANVIIFVVDGLVGLTDSDYYIAKQLYKTEKPVIVAVNKIDDLVHVHNAYEFYSLGFQDPIAISSHHGIGVGDLLDKVLFYMTTEDKPAEKGVISFAVIGRPNVGKSSLVNAIIGEERVIVSEISGTTTDAIDTSFIKDKQKYTVIDTAGIKKRGKVYENLDKYSVLRALTALERADVALLVLDGEAGIQEQDGHVAGYIMEYKRACIIVVNKWDLVEKDSKTMKKFEEKIREEFKFLTYAPIVFLSAKENQRVHTVFPVLQSVYENFTKELSTKLINDTLIDAVLMNPPSVFNQGKAKFNYATQTDIKPPTITMFVNEPKYIHFSYERYLQNQFRAVFDLTGSPLKFVFRKKESYED